MTCSLCTNKILSRGLCSAHYQKAHREANKEKYKGYRLAARERNKNPQKPKFDPHKVKGNDLWQELSREDYEWRMQHQ